MDLEEARQVLGVASDASPNGIRTEFRRLMREHHPDTAGVGSTARATRIIEAYSLLEQVTTHADSSPSDVRSATANEPSRQARSPAEDYAAHLVSVRATRARQREARHVAARAAATQRAEEVRARPDPNPPSPQDAVANILFRISVVGSVLLGLVTIFMLFKFCTGDIPTN